MRIWTCLRKWMNIIVERTLYTGAQKTKVKNSKWVKMYAWKSSIPFLFSRLSTYLQSLWIFVFSLKKSWEAKKCQNQKLLTHSEDEWKKKTLKNNPTACVPAYDCSSAEKLFGISPAGVEIEPVPSTEYKEIRQNESAETASNAKTLSLPGVHFINCFAPYAQLLRSFLEA